MFILIESFFGSSHIWDAMHSRVQDFTDMKTVTKHQDVFPYLIADDIQASNMKTDAMLHI